VREGRANRGLRGREGSVAGSVRGTQGDSVRLGQLRRRRVAGELTTGAGAAGCPAS